VEQARSAGPSANSRKRAVSPLARFAGLIVAERCSPRVCAETRAVMERKCPSLDTNPLAGSAPQAVTGAR
jgi:hypothetical protein